MSNMRPDGRAPGTPLHTPQGQEADAPSGSTKAPTSPDRPSRGSRAPSPAPSDGVGKRITAGMSQSLHLRSPMKLPEGGQLASAKSAPASTTHAKDATKSLGSNASVTEQKRTAEALIDASGAAMSPRVKELCKQLIGMVDKKEGFKSLVATCHEPSFVGVVCHDASQLKGDKGVDHMPMARNMAHSFTTQESLGNMYGAPEDRKNASLKLRKALFGASMKSSSFAAKPSDMAFFGTRMLRNSADGHLWLEPSGSYGFNSQAMRAEAHTAVAKLHANLLTGAGISAQSLQCHPNNDNMQALVDAIKQLMLGSTSS